MALIKCPECGKDVSDKANTCPHCGTKIKVKKFNKMIFISIISICLLIGLAIIVNIAYNNFKKQNMSDEELISQNSVNKNISKEINDETINDINQLLLFSNELIKTVDATEEQPVDIINNELLDVCDKITNNRYVKKYIDDQSTDETDEIKYKHVESAYNLVTILNKLINESVINYPEIEPYTSDETLNKTEVEIALPYIKQSIEEIKSIRNNQTYGDNSESVAKLMENDVRDTCESYDIILDNDLNIVTIDDVDLDDTQSTIKFDEKLWNDFCDAFHNAIDYYYR